MSKLLSTRNGRVKAARALTRRTTRDERGLFLAEGAKTIREALGAGDVVEVFATAGADAAERDLREEVAGRDLPWHVVEDAALASLAGTVTPQGLVAVCCHRHVPLASLAGDLLAVCADVRDPGNAGTVIRCADAAGADGVVLTGHSVDPYNDKTVRATVGSLFHLPLALEPNATAAVRHLRTAGWTVLAADGAGELGLHDPATAEVMRSGPVAWLFGNEAWGLPEALAGEADHRVAIPLHGRAESLNLAMAAAVCLYESARVQHAPRA